MKKVRTETTGTTQKTNDYSLFKTHKVNRKILPKKVNALMKLMEEFGWLVGSYIIVDKHFTIINGQHRFEAARMLGIDIHFVQINEVATPKLIREHNLNQTPWTLENTLEGFANEGHENYIEVDEFRKQYPQFTFTDTLMLANMGARCMKKEVESGNFKMVNPEGSKEWAERFVRLEVYIPKMTRHFTRALVKVFNIDVFDFERFMKKIETYPYLMRDYKHLGRNVELFDEIYNKGTHKKNRISFNRYDYDNC